jgi:ligand-binding SRPBCC domain-containing protein
MAEINLATHVNAPADRLFDLSRSIDFHCHSTSRTRERAVGAVTGGLIGLNQEVTWRARHFMLWQELTVKVTAFTHPTHFRDEQVKGAFKSMRHDHYFDPQSDGSTLMRDVFAYETPFGPVGRIFDRLFLQHYFRRFLAERNTLLKNAAESDEWRRYL